MKNHLRFLLGFVFSMINFEFLCSQFDSEVALFIVDKAHHREGLGRALMDHFVDHAGLNNRKTVYLGTDVESCCGFSEWYGFKKHRDFHETASR
jgi:GNAT superfamily N-acetyltransferase